MPFISFSGLIAMAKIDSNMLNRNGQSGHPCLVPDLRGSIQLFTLNMMLPVGLAYMTFVMLRYVPSIPTLLSVFNHEWMSNFFKCCLTIFLDDHIVFILPFVNMMYHVD